MTAQGSTRLSPNETAMAQLLQERTMPVEFALEGETVTLRRCVVSVEAEGNEFAVTLTGQRRAGTPPVAESVCRQLEALCEETNYLWFVDASAMTWDGQRYADELFIKDGIHLNHEGQLLWMRDYIRPMIETLVSEFDLTQVQKEG